MKVTLPVGVPAPGATTPTVAVNVIDWPKPAGLRLEATLVVVAACPIVCVSVAEVLAVKLVSPP